MRLGSAPCRGAAPVSRYRVAAAGVALVGAFFAIHAFDTAAQGRIALVQARELADGVALFHVTDPSILDPPAPLSIWLLRIDPARADLRAALGNDEVMDTETVAETALRHQAIAAVNAGFFLPNGDPAGIFKLGGQLISETSRSRGAVGIVRADGHMRLVFDRVTAGLSLLVERGKRAPVRVPIAAVDTTRRLGRLMLFTPAYHAHTDTAPGGLEWVVDGTPLRVIDGPRADGKTPIPRAGFVLSFGGRSAPAGLKTLARGTRVRIDTRYQPVASAPGDWEAAHEIIGGAGLLARDGRYIEDWAEESFAKGFAEMRHPRTMIGTASDGTVWLVTVDGRQQALSVGMTLVELREFARRLDLVSALNLDGGGSTTMWVDGAVVNSPSDAAGPRKVGDALLVFPRARAPRDRQ